MKSVSKRMNCKLFSKKYQKNAENVQKFAVRRNADLKPCRSRKTLKNAPTLAIGGADTAENGPSKVRQVTNCVRRNIGLDHRVLLSAERGLASLNSRSFDPRRSARGCSCWCKIKKLSADFHAELSRNFSDLTRRAGWLGQIKSPSLKIKQTLRGSFSAVSTPPIARACS